MIMNVARNAYIENLYQDYQYHDKAQHDRIKRWRSINPEAAALLSFMVLSKQAKHILEIGTSGGYSTLWLADAAEQTKGHITSLDIDAHRQNVALQHLKNTHLDDTVTLICQDALQFLQENTQSYDVILLDAERKYYVSYWETLSRCLHKSGSVLIVDNVISHANEVQDFIQLVADDMRFRHSILSVGAGLLLVVRQ